MVVWRADLYEKEALRQLSDTSFYAKIDKDLTSANQQIVKSTINDLIVKQELPATATNLIITTLRTSCIYFLPKIHKPNNPGRPIVSACSCPTELISSYLDKVMAPIVRSLPSYIKDSQHALQIFAISTSRAKTSIFTMNITSLYTVIPNGEGLLALKHSHPSCVKNSIPYSQFLRLRRLCSDDSDFSLKSDEMCNFFNKRDYPASVVPAGHHRTQQIDRQSALQTSQRENNERIPFTLTFHPHNHAVKSIILKKL